TDGEDRRNAGPIVGVDLDRSLVAKFDPRHVEPEARAVWFAPDREEELVGLDVVAAGHGHVQRAAIALLDLLDRGMEPEVDALADRDLHQPVDDLLVVL